MNRERFEGNDERAAIVIHCRGGNQSLEMEKSKWRTMDKMPNLENI